MVLSKALIANGTCDGKPLCALAKKVPQSLKGTVKSGAGAVNHDKLNRGKLVAIVDKLYKRQGYISDIYSVLYSEDYPMGEDPDEVAVDQTWPAGGVKTLKKIPKAWMAWWLLQVCGDFGLTKEMITGMEKEDSSNIGLVFSAALQLQLKAPLPASLQNDGDLAALVFAARAKEVGDIVKRLVEKKAIGINGIQYLNYKAFELEFKGGQATSIKHIPTGEVAKPPSHVCILAAFEMVDAWFDATAKVTLKPSEFVLHSLFPESSKLVEFLGNDKATALQRLVNAHSEGKLARSGAEIRRLPSNDGGAAVREAKKDCAKTRVKSARSALTKKAQEREKKRRITLG